MAVSININNLSLVHMGSNGVATATVPDVCLTPAPPGPPVPVPYPNIAQSNTLSGGTQRVSVDGGMPAAHKPSRFAVSTGDEAGVVGGVASGTIKGAATWITASVNVMIEGNPACRLSDKMMMNNRNTSCLAGVIQPPVMPDIPPQDSRPPPEKCATGPVMAKCGHGERGYQLMLPSASSGNKPVPPNVLQVVAAPGEPETVVVKTSLIKPLCGDHGPEALKLADGSPMVSSPVQLSFEAECHEHYSLFNPLALLWPFPAVVRQYTVQNPVCHPGGGADVLVEVYPDINWKLAIKLSMSYGIKGKAQRDKTGKSKKSKDKVSEKTAFSGELTLQLGSKSYPLVKKKKDLKRALFMMEAVKKFARKLFMALAKIGGVKLSILWPNFSLDGSYGYKENPETGGVEYPLELKVKFAPLIGIKGEVEILDFLLRLIPPPAGPVLVKIKGVATKGVKSKTITAQAVIGVWLYASASISGDLDYKRELGADSTEAKGSITGEIMLGIRGELSGKLGGEVSVFAVKTTAGLTGKAETAVYAKLMAAADDEGVYCTGELGWRGLMYAGCAYYSAEAKFGPFKKGTSGKSKVEAKLFGPEKYDFNNRRLWLMGNG